MTNNRMQRNERRTRFKAMVLTGSIYALLVSGLFFFNANSGGTEYIPDAIKELLNIDQEPEKETIKKTKKPRA